MARCIDITGREFGRLCVIQRLENYPNGKSRWLCKCSCGNEKAITGCQLRSGTRSCGCLTKEVNRQKRGEHNPLWKGGRSFTAKGYVYIARSLAEQLYPNAQLGECYTNLPEHIVVMSHHLGRKLYDDETVHHKNGIRSDNTLDNLELKASSHGKGQTIPDLLAWAHEIIRRYEPIHS